MSEVISDAAHEIHGAIYGLKTCVESAIDKLTATIADRADQLMDVLSASHKGDPERPRRMIRLGTDTIVNADSLQSAKFHQLSEERSIVTMQLVGGTAIAAEATPEQFRLLTAAMEGKPEDDKPRYYLINNRDVSMITAFKHESIKTIERQIDGRNLDDFEVLVDDANGVRLIDLADHDPSEIPSLLS